MRWLTSRQPSVVETAVTSPAGKARERVLTEDELRVLWNALGDDDDYGDIVRLLTLTGCRRDEIGNLQWDEVDLDPEARESGRGRRPDRRDLREVA